MSSKMNYIPHISSYEDIRAEMSNDLQYRLADRTAKTSRANRERRHLNCKVQSSKLNIQRSTLKAFY